MKSRIHLWQMFILVAGCSALMAMITDYLKAVDPALTWITRLRSNDVDKRLEALRELNLLGSRARAAVKALHEALVDVDPRVRAGASRVIANVVAGDRQDPHFEEIRAALVRALVDPVASVRHRAATALASIDPTHELLISSLADAIGDEDPMVRSDALNGLLNFAVGGDDGAFRLILASALGRDPQDRETAILALGARSLPDVFKNRASPLVVAAMNDPSASVRNAANTALENLAHDEAFSIGGLTRAMTDPSPGVRKLAITSTFYKIKGRAALTILSRAIVDPDPSVRLATCQWFSRWNEIAPEEAIPLLARASRDENKAVSEAAKSSIKEHDLFLSMFEQRLLPGLLSQSVSTDPRVRREAVKRIGEWGKGSPRGLAALVRSLDDPDPIVRNEASLAMELFGPSAKATLLELEKFGPSVRTALLDLERRISDQDDLVRYEAALIRQGASP